MTVAGEPSEVLVDEMPGASPGVLFGVDVVSVGRVVRAIDYSSTTYTRHVTADGERRLHSDLGLATAATVAVKEGLIKAVGGRPPGFSWHDFTACGPGAVHPPAWAPPLLTAAVPAVGAATGVHPTESCAYVVHGASRAAALARLAADPDHTSVVGLARWGRRGDVIVALAILATTSRGDL